MFGTMTPFDPTTPCPCGSADTYARCCQPCHLGTPAMTAEALMRSRYSAFHRGDTDYLVKTLHPSKRRPTDASKLRATVDGTEWLSLRVLDTRAGGAADTDGEVEFVAAFRESGVVQRLHERSTFVREGGRWFYVDGIHRGLKTPPDPGRNEPCWCGGGKKFKKCHGA